MGSSSDGPFFFVRSESACLNLLPYHTEFFLNYYANGESGSICFIKPKQDAVMNVRIDDARTYMLFPRNRSACSVFPVYLPAKSFNPADNANLWVVHKYNPFKSIVSGAV